MIDYKIKYIKYKIKYLKLKGGSSKSDETMSIEDILGEGNVFTTFQSKLDDFLENTTKVINDNKDLFTKESDKFLTSLNDTSIIPTLDETEQFRSTFNDIDELLNSSFEKEAYKIADEFMKKIDALTLVNFMKYEELSSDQSVELEKSRKQQRLRLENLEKKKQIKGLFQNLVEKTISEINNVKSEAKILIEEKKNRIQNNKLKLLITSFTLDESDENELINDILGINYVYSQNKVDELLKKLYQKINYFFDYIIQKVLIYKIFGNDINIKKDEKKQHRKNREEYKKIILPEYITNLLNLFNYIIKLQKLNSNPSESAIYKYILCFNETDAELEEDIIYNNYLNIRDYFNRYPDPVPELILNYRKEYTSITIPNYREDYTIIFKFALFIIFDYYLESYFPIKKFENFRKYILMK